MLSVKEMVMLMQKCISKYEEMKKVAHSKIKLKFVWENFISTLKARSFRVIFVQQILTEYLPCIKHCWRHRLYNSESN